MSKAEPRMTRSGVADAVTGQQKMDGIRTSSGMFSMRGENQVPGGVTYPPRHPHHRPHP